MSNIELTSYEVNPILLNTEQQNITFFIKKGDREYKYLFRTPCFFTNCTIAGTQYICAYSNSEYILIGFNTGKPNCIMSHDIDLNNFKIFLEKLCIILYNEGGEKIVLFGFSYGMTSAILTAYILLCLQGSLTPFTNPSLSLLNKQITELKTNIDVSDPIYKQVINNLEIIVIGSGGIPNLFTDIEDFSAYYNALKTNYIHFVSTISSDSVIDETACSIECNSTIYSNFIVCIIYTEGNSFQFKFKNINNCKIYTEATTVIQQLHHARFYNEILDHFLNQSN